MQKARHSERGMVLIITLLALVAMLLVSTALLRSSDTSVQVVNNLSFRQAAEAAAHMAIEQVIAGGAACLPSKQAGESKEGIPGALLHSEPQSGESVTNISGMRVRMFCERMCSDPNLPLTADNCLFADREGSGGYKTRMDGQVDEEGPGRSTLVSRVSVRIDGSKNTAVFAQVFVTL
jgi:type II secretory pathway pseudopilin PulG